MKLLRHTLLAVAALILLGHSFVPHTHLSENEDETFHYNNDEHQGIGDLIVCFFQVDHDSEDLDNFSGPDTDTDTALLSNGYAVIPAVFFNQRPAEYREAEPFDIFLSSLSLRGPPAV